MEKLFLDSDKEETEDTTRGIMEAKAHLENLQKNKTRESSKEQTKTKNSQTSFPKQNQ